MTSKLPTLGVLSLLFSYLTSGHLTELSLAPSSKHPSPWLLRHCTLLDFLPSSLAAPLAPLLTILPILTCQTWSSPELEPRLSSFLSLGDLTYSHFFKH